MAFEREWEASTPNQAASGHMILRSEGWSGKIISRDLPDLEDRKFQFKIDMESYSDSYFVGITGELHTTENSYGYVSTGNKCVVGISLEHFGVANLGNNEYRVNMLGLDIENADPSHRSDAVGAWGSQSPFTSVDMNYGYGFSVTNLVGVNAYSGDDFTIADGGIGSIGCGNNVDALLHRVLDYGNWARHSETILETDLPIFETDADLLAWCQDPTNPELIATMLNPPVDPEQAAEEAYAASQRYYYLRNKFKVSTNGSTFTATINNINAKPYGKGKICLYKKKHTQLGSGASWYSYYLKGTDSYNYQFKTAPWNSFRWDDEDTDITASTALNMVNTVGYIKKSANYTAAGVEFVVEYADTNIPIYGSEELADQYLNDEIDIDQAENYDEIIQEEQKHIIPPWGEEDVEGDNGANEQDYSVGARMFAILTNTYQLRDFFDAIFDPDATDDILTKNGLFGENQINCIQGLMYLPINVQNFATLGGLESIKLGGWDSEVLAKPVTKNNKMWDVGSTYITPVFNDFRDMEPYQQLFISLPYCGLHALNISKYLGKTLSIKYACDLSTGSCSAHIYANGVEYDTFDGNMASQRPITALDQQAYVSAIIKAVGGFADTVMEPISGKVEVAANALTGNVGAAVGSAVNTSMKDSTLVPRLAYSGAGIAQSIQQKPMSFKGGYFGALGLFGNQRCHLIVAQRNTVRAVNELATIGYPSGYGGTVGSFSGYLQCSSFKMAEGFAGTAEEAAEITAMMSEGVYL